MITAEKLQHRIETLTERHDALDKIIQQHYNSYVDDTTIKSEKVEKLRLKSEIEELQHKLETLN